VIAPRAAENEQVLCLTRGFSDQYGSMMAAVRYPAAKLAGGATIERSFMVYGGPKLYDLLETVSSTGPVNARLEESVYLGWFPWLTRPLLSLLRMFHGWVGNWGVAIILLTLFVKLATLYWTIKSSRSMKAMAGLKPKMDELRKKYGEDKQRMNVEMMNLYKTHNVNPLSGCLPMLLQMPVWIALYSALNASAELYQAPFVGWLRDLTSPDPYYIIPVLTMVLMFLQQKITPTTIDSAQQRMMMIMMPITFGVFSLFFPSGLTVYILTNSVLTMVQQVYINKSNPKPATPVVVAPVKKDEGPTSGGDGGGGAAKGGGGGGGKRKPGGGKGRPAKA
jgi:YidC/Oxa1 family membrane protein insertase